ncbi:unnamed protein product [Trifolium pratense]|uniref:Uncharacterized protein n=1 Tax=Trifolium pratense TaxID=57577 RepID=A0ACB0LQQ0_TRIPR|nr:unnamed protein product [Trifolium pratense]
MCVFFLLMLLLILLLLLSSNIASCEGALTGNKARFDRFRSGSFKTSSKKFHGAFQGNNANKNGDEVFGDDKRKVYTGPNPLHNR